MKTINLSNIVAEMNKFSYRIFSSGTYNLNLVGLRVLPGTPNTFDDYMAVFYKINGQQQFHLYNITTDPGFYYLRNPMNKGGTAVLIPGQYRSAWKMGTHHGYKALMQNGSPFKVWRDKDKDDYVDYNGPVYTDVTGLNCHHAGLNSFTVDSWSAGCIVFKRLAAWNEFIDLCQKQIDHGMGATYTYTLLNWE